MPALFSPMWIAITIANLEDARVAEFITALREEALGQNQTDPSPRIIQDIVEEVRRCIAFCPSTPLDARTDAIPVGLKPLVVGKIVRTLKARLMIALTEDERTDERLYQKRLEQLTKCEWPVDKPDTPIADAPVEPAGGITFLGADKRRFKKGQLDGL